MAPHAEAPTDSEPDGDILLAVHGLTKRFGAIQALTDVSFAVRGGQITALVGQNGSGKSTLVKCLAGLVVSDSGSIELAKHVEGDSRLHFIHQDLGLVSSMSAVDNLSLRSGGHANGLRRVRRNLERARAVELLGSFGCWFDVDAPIVTLSAAERSVIAIARALDGWTSGRNILILDEPTAALHKNEVDLVFAAVRQVAARGGAVVFISHRLDEVLSLSDRIVALRDGRVIADKPSGDVDHDALIRLIAGTALATFQHTAIRSFGAVALAVENLSVGAARALTFEIRRGEILGISGSLGSGREHLAQAIFDPVVREGGTVSVSGRRCEGHVSDSIRAGIALVPGNRRAHGTLMTMTVRENLTLPTLAPYRRALRHISVTSERADVRTWADRVHINPREPELGIAALSGGNQQKVVLARWLRNEPTVLVLDEPTQGVDVGAKASIYRLIEGAAEGGVGILVCSSDTEELAALCDRVIVLRDGEAVGELIRPDLSEQSLISIGLGLPPTANPVALGGSHD